MKEKVQIWESNFTKWIVITRFLQNHNSIMTRTVHLDFFISKRIIITWKTINFVNDISLQSTFQEK